MGSNEQEGLRHINESQIKGACGSVVGQLKASVVLGSGHKPWSFIFQFRIALYSCGATASERELLLDTCGHTKVRDKIKKVWRRPAKTLWLFTQSQSRMQVDHCAN